jgi:pimeloyl-ACP methyl ester carboxylesterase
MRQALSSDDQPIAVHDLGPGDRPTLLCHATGFNGGAWGPLATALGDGFDRWAMDFRAHGSSPLVDGAPLEWTSMRDDVLAVVDELDVEPGTLLGLGHSMGGCALALAEQARPGTFAGLWLFEPVIAPWAQVSADLSGANPLAEGAARRRASFPSFEAALANYAGKRPLSTLRADALDAYVRSGFEEGDDGQVHLRCRPEHEAAVFRASSGNDAFERLGELGCPVRVAKGGDEVGVAAFAPAVAEAIPQGTLEQHLHLGHFGPLEAPAELTVSVRAFAAGL